METGENKRKWRQSNFPSTEDGFPKGTKKELSKYKPGEDSFLDMLQLKRGGKASDAINIGLVIPPDRGVGEEQLQSAPNNLFDQNFWHKNVCYATQNFRLRRNVFFGSVGPDGKNSGDSSKAYHTVHIISMHPTNFGERYKFRYGDLDDVIHALQLIKNDIESTFPENQNQETEEEEEGLSATPPLKLPVAKNSKI